MFRPSPCGGRGTPASCSAKPHSTTTRRTVSDQNGTGDDHHAFHEDAKPGDLAGQLPIRWRSSSNQLVTR